MEQWIKTAKSLLGTKEAPGPKNNATIMGWATRLGNKAIGMVYNADSVPWCGLFVAHCIKEAGLTLPAVPVRAASWKAWGQPCNPTPGCVVVFERKGGGHVGFMVGENKENYRVLGGNQSDNVTETWIAKERAVAFRWPAGQVVPQVSLPQISAAGAVSNNEA